MKISLEDLEKIINADFPDSSKHIMIRHGEYFVAVRSHRMEAILVCFAGDTSLMKGIPGRNLVNVSFGIAGCIDKDVKVKTGYGFANSLRDAKRQIKRLTKEQVERMYNAKF